MKPIEIYDELKRVAEKLDITVSEHNFRNTGILVKSGLCKVRGQFHFIMDKHKSIQKKIALLADCINTFPHENVYVMPAVRDVLLGQATTGDDGDDE